MKPPEKSITHSLDGVELNEKTKALYEVVVDLHNVLTNKNTDYGDSFGIQFEKYGAVSGVIRLEDKMNRLTNLVSKESEKLVNDESLADTVLDIAGYAVLLYERLMNEKNKPI